MIGYTTRYNMIEVVEIGGNIERESMHGYPSGNFYTDCAQRKPKKTIRNKAQEDWWCLGASMMYSKKVYDEVGGYKEKCYYAQDYNLWLRIIKNHRFSIARKNLYLKRRFSKLIRFARPRLETDWRKVALENAD